MASSRPRLSPRARNRALLARQGLLERSDRSPTETIEHLVGMQAQAPDAPYVGLWSRIENFDPTGTARAIEAGALVRMTLMRATIHLVTARDARRLRPLLQPMLEARWRASPFAKRLAGADIDPVLAAGAELLAAAPRTRPQLSAALSERFAGLDPESLAYAVTFRLPIVQVPPRGVWGRRGPAAFTPIGLGAALSPDEAVLRYLAAFGPATVADAQWWSGLTRLREVFERLRPHLLAFADGYFDLPDAPRPDPATPAPVRLLPEYDNVLLSHADRAHLIPDGRRVPLPPGNGARAGTVLVDGRMAGEWRIRDGGLELTPDVDVGAEGERLQSFVRSR